MDCTVNGCSSETVGTDGQATQGFGHFVSFTDDLQSLQLSLETGANNRDGLDVTV